MQDVAMQDARVVIGAGPPSPSLQQQQHQMKQQQQPQHQVQQQPLQNGDLEIQDMLGYGSVRGERGVD